MILFIIFVFILEIHGCLLPSGSFCKKKLAKRPGYMRTGKLQQIEFHPPIDCELLIPKEPEHHDRKHQRDFKCSLKRPCKNKLGLSHCNAHVCTKVPSDVATGSATVETAADHRVQQSENLILPVSPPVAVCKEDALPVYSSHPGQTDLLDSVKDTACSGSSQEKKRMHAFGQKAVNDNQEVENKETVGSSSISQGHFNSSFSFIQQSLNPAFEKSGIVGPLDYSDSKDILQVCKVGKSDNGNSHVPWEGQGTLGGKLWASSDSCVCVEDCKCSRETKEDNLYGFETLSLLHANAAFSCSSDSLDATSAGSSVTSGYESSTNVSDHSWDSLIRKYEPILQECLLRNQSVLKVGFFFVHACFVLYAFKQINLWVVTEDRK